MLTATCFVLAMAHWQLGHKDEAHRAYDKGVEQMAQQEKAFGYRVTKRFAGEAAELLGVDER